MKATAKAHTNVALIKYWGKRDEQLILPANSSLSLTLDQFYTETSVEWRTDLNSDQFSLNGKLKQDKKVVQFLDHIRSKFGILKYAHISSVNHVPTAAGLASSASAFAALALASVAALGETLSNQALSQLARRGSGSACRSIYGGFAIWQKGKQENGSDSFAIPFFSPLANHMAMIVAVVSDRKKSVSSRYGMKLTVDTSPYFKAWYETAEQDLLMMKEAIKQEDFTHVGEITEKSAMKMHATTMGANPPFSYLKPKSLAVIEAVYELRNDGIEAYFTMDAGPNVKVICQRKDERRVSKKIAEIIDDVLICHAGEGAKVVNIK